MNLDINQRQFKSHRVDNNLQKCDNLECEML